MNECGSRSRGERDGKRGMQLWALSGAPLPGHELIDSPSRDSSWCICDHRSQDHVSGGAVGNIGALFRCLLVGIGIIVAFVIVLAVVEVVVKHH